MNTSEQDKPRRAYRSTRREQQAAETRSAVLDAALLLFADRGWAATGMRDVAREAGVSVETVYANFGSKSDLLIAAIEVTVVGDAQPGRLAEREEFLALGSGDLPARAHAAAHMVTEIHVRNAAMIRALRQAAASDAEAARRLREGELRRREDAREAAGMIAGHAVTAQDGDGLWAVTDVEVYRLLTDLGGWTADEYEVWLSDVIERLLTHTPGKARPRRQGGARS